MSGIEEFQLDIKSKENDKVMKEKRKTKNLRVITVDNKPCIQLVKPKNGIIKEIDISKIAGVFLSKNSKEKCFKLIFPDKIMIFYQSDNKTHYSAFLKKLNDEVDINYKREPLPLIKMRSHSVIIDKKPYQRMLVKSHSLALNNPMDVLFDRYYSVPEIDLNVNPLNENHQFTDVPQDFPVSYIYKLRYEIDHIGGIKLDLSEKGSGKFTFTMMNNYLWVSNTAYPDKIKKELHFGDRIVSVNGNKIRDILHFQELLKYENIPTLILQRLPKAKVFLMVGTYENVKIKKNKFLIDEADSLWQITEINGENLLDSSENKGKMVKSLIHSNTILGVVLHEKAFIKSLREQNKTRRSSIKV